MVKKDLVIKTKYGSFKCVFEAEKDMGGYAVEACGVSGAVSWGKNLSEAKNMIVEARAVANAEKKGIIQVKNHRQPLPLL